MILKQPLKNVYIAVPIPSQGRIVTALVMRLIKWSKMGAEVNVITGSIIDHARNIAVRAFLKGNKEYFIFIDSDTVPEVDHIEKLIKSKKDIIGGLYNLLVSKPDGSTTTKWSAYSMIFDDKPLMEAVAVFPNTGLQKVQGMGTGILLITRDVFKAIPQPWFDMKWKDKEHTEFLGEDIGFCEKARQQGITLWCNTNLRSLHLKEIYL